LRGSCAPTFRDNLSFPSSRFTTSKDKAYHQLFWRQKSVEAVIMSQVLLLLRCVLRCPISSLETTNTSTESPGSSHLLIGLWVTVTCSINTCCLILSARFTFV
jgi:hypothetical protein